MVEEVNEMSGGATLESGPAKRKPRTQEGSAPVLSLKDQRRPIVVRIKGKKKSKRKYTRGTKDLQIGLRTATRANDRLIGALADGFEKYRKRSNRSSRKKRDGALRDLFKNSAAGWSTTLRRSSKVPVIMAKAIRGRVLRRSVRNMGRLVRLFIG